MVDYFREGQLVPNEFNQEEPTVNATTGTPFSQSVWSQKVQRNVANVGYNPYPPLVPTSDRGDMGIAFDKGKRLLSGSAEVLFKGFSGELMKSLGMQEASNSWISDAYQSGLLMGMDVNDLDNQLKGPRTLEEIEDWKGSIAWGINAVAEQIPNLVTTFAPAVIGTLIFKRPTLGTVGTLGTIDFLNTAEVYTDLLMETGESRPAVAAATGTLMSSLDMIMPMKVIGAMGKGTDFAKWFGKNLKGGKISKLIANSIGAGVTEGTTEYIQTMMEGVALNYVQEKDLLAEFSEAQRAEQLESGARGALVGTLLGIPISYSGISARKKAAQLKQTAKDTILNNVKQSNANDQETLGPDLENFSLFGVDDSGIPDLSQNIVTPSTGRVDVIPSPIFKQGLSDEEFGIFTMTGDVSQETLENIAYDIANNYELTQQEQAILSNPVARQKIINLIAQKEQTLKQEQLAKQYFARLKKNSIDGILSAEQEVSDLNPIIDVKTQTRGPVGPPKEAPTVPTAEEARKILERNPDRTTRLSNKYFENLAKQVQREDARTEQRGKDPIEGKVVGKETKRVIGLPTQDDVSTAEATNLGYQRDAETIVLNDAGTQERISRGKAERTKVYRHENVVIKKADPLGVESTTLESTTTTRGSPWVAIDKSSGAILKSVPSGKKGRLKDGKELSNKELFPVEIYSETDSNVRMLLAEFQETTGDASGVTFDQDIESRVLTQELGKLGDPDRIDAGDKVRWRNKRTEKYLSDDIYLVNEKPEDLTINGKKVTSFRVTKMSGGGGVERTINIPKNSEDTLVLAYSAADSQKGKGKVEIVTSEEYYSTDPTLTEEGKAKFAEETGQSREKVTSNKKRFLEKIESSKQFKNNLIKALTRLELIGGLDDVRKTLREDSTRISLFSENKEDNFEQLGKSSEENIDAWVNKALKDSSPIITENLKSVEILSRADLDNKTKEVTEFVDSKVSKSKTVKDKKIPSTSLLSYDAVRGEKPTPETYRVKLSKEAANKLGLDPEFYYDWENISSPQWGEQRDDFIKVSGQVIRQKNRDGVPSDIIDIKVRPPKAKAPTKESLEEIDVANLPDKVPNKETVDKAFIDQLTGLLVIKRKESDQVEVDGYKLFVDDDEKTYDVEVYLISNNKFDAEAKQESIFQNYFSSTVIGEGKGDTTVPALEKRVKPEKAVAKIKQEVKGEVKELPIKVKEINSVIEEPGAIVRVKVSPMIIAKVNRERVDQGLKKIKIKDFFTASIGSRKDLIQVSLDGTVRQMKLTSILDATVERFVPDNQSAKDYFEVNLARDPDASVTLISSFKKLDKGKDNRFKKNEEGVSYEDFVNSIYRDTSYRHGVFNTNKDQIIEKREQRFNESKGKKAVVQLYSGVQLTGVVKRASNGSLELVQLDTKDFAPSDTAGGRAIQKREIQKRVSNLKPTIIDLLNIESIQIEKPKSKYVPELTPVKDIERSGEMIVFTRGEEKDTDLSRTTPLSVTDSINEVTVYKLRNKDLYNIFVDDTRAVVKGKTKTVKFKEMESVSLEDTIKFLNELEQDTGGNIRLRKLPSTIVAEPVTYTKNLLTKRKSFEKKYDPSAVKYVYKKAPAIESKRTLGNVVRDKKLLAKANDLIKAGDNLDQLIEKDKRELELDRESDAILKAATLVGDAKRKDKDLAEVTDATVDTAEDNNVAEVTDPVDTSVSDVPVDKEVITVTDKPIDKSKRQIGNFKIGEEFTDNYGGVWKVVQKVNQSSYLQFLKGTAPALPFKVSYKNKKDVANFSPGFQIEVDNASTPNSLKVRISHDNFETDFENYSIVRPVPADAEGSIQYNTGMTPQTFKESIGKTIGRLNLKRVIDSGEVNIVQNQQDLPFNVVNMGVKAVTRDGNIWFVTNNIKESEITGVYLHEMGVHLGLKQIYGGDFSSLLGEVKSRRNSPEWKDAFDTATNVADQKTFGDDIARENYILEEALGYFVETNADYKNSFWQIMFDGLKRLAARVKMYIGMPVSDGQLVAFARGAARGMSQRNRQQSLDLDDEEYYSVAPNAFDKVFDSASELLNIDSAQRIQYKDKASGTWSSVQKFFDPFANLPFARDFRKLRSLLGGKLGEVDKFAEAVLIQYDNLNEQENQELFDYFTDANATPESISRKDLRETSVALKEKIMEIADEGKLRNMYPEASEEQMQELRGAYLPRVFLYHLLQRGFSTGAGQKTTSKRDYTNLRIEDMDSDLREMWGEIKDVRYLLYRAVTIPQQDIAIVDFLEQVSVQQAFRDTDEAIRINSDIDKLEIERQGEDTSQDRRQEIVVEIKDLKKELKELRKSGGATVKGEIPWVMPNQWLYIKQKGKDGKEIPVRSTLASVNRQINSLSNYEQNVPNLTDKARQNILSRIAVLENAKKEFYDSVGVNPNLKQEKLDKELDSYYDDNYDISLFEQIPNKEKFGTAAGLYVRKEIYEDIVGNADMVSGQQNLFQKMLLPYGKHAKLVSIFKTMKVPLNPPTVVRNIGANLINMQLLGGVAFHRQPKQIMEALREMRGQERGTELIHSETGKKFTPYELAMEQGIGATTLTSAELRKLEKVFAFMETDGLAGIFTKGRKYWNQIADFGSNLYQGIETLGKVVVISDMLQNQRPALEKILSESGSKTLTIEDIAVQEANRVLFDYSEVSPTIRGLRSSFLGAPFITFQVKVLPELAKIAADPSKWHRLLPYVMMVGGMQALFGGIPFDDDNDWDKMQELLPEWTKDNTMVFLPWKDSNGNWQAVDLSYFFPWSWFTQMSSNIMKGELGKAAVEGGVIGPGFQLMTTFITGKDPWSGYDVINENDSTSDKVFDFMSYANSTIMPPWLTRNGIVSISSLSEAMVRMDPSELEGKLPDLMLGKTNRYGEPRRSAMGVLGSAVGLTAYAVSPQARSRQSKRYMSDIRGLKADITSVRKDGKLTPKEKSRKTNAIRDKIDEFRKEMSEFNTKTSGIKRSL